MVGPIAGELALCVLRGEFGPPREARGVARRVVVCIVRRLDTRIIHIIFSARIIFGLLAHSGTSTDGSGRSGVVGVEVVFAASMGLSDEERADEHEVTSN